jgi:hypothetical protein
MLAIRTGREVMMARRILISLALVALVFGSSAATAQPRGGGGGGGGPSSGGARGGGPGAGPGGAWHGGGGYGGGYGGDPHGGGYGGGYGGDRHGGGWYGGWYGPNVGLYLGSPYWGAWPYSYGYSWPYGYTWPYGYSWPYGYTYGYAAPYGYAPREPSVYIEEAPQPPAPHYWYYCTSPAGYYPYVQRCASPWMTVVPQDVPGASGAPAPSEPSGGAGGPK